MKKELSCGLSIGYHVTKSASIMRLVQEIRTEMEKRNESSLCIRALPKYL